MLPLRSSINKHWSCTVCLLVNSCSWTKHSSPTESLLYHNPAITHLPINLLVPTSLCVSCVSVISSPFHPPSPPLFHSSITQDASPSWKQASHHEKGRVVGGQVSGGVGGGGQRGCLCHSSAYCRPDCGPSWGNRAYVTLAQPLAHTCCHQNGGWRINTSVAAAPHTWETQKPTLPAFKVAGKLQMLPISRCGAAVSLNHKNWGFLSFNGFTFWTECYWMTNFHLYELHLKTHCPTRHTQKQSHK